MTTETSTPALDPSLQSVDGDDGALRCYRHPDRETWIRCGRCDRPICTRCSMIGPVGSRCRDCGRPAFDPLTSFTPAQLVGGIAVSLIGGVIGGFIGLEGGPFFAVILGPFIGGFIAEAVVRVTGYKHGRVMTGLVLGGIALGALIALVPGWRMFTFGIEEELPFEFFLSTYALWGLVFAGAAMAGAWTRLR